MGDTRNAFRILVRISTWTKRGEMDFKEDGSWTELAQDKWHMVQFSVNNAEPDYPGYRVGS